MRTHRQSPSGFTLVELLVVMSLMAILATLAIAFLPNAASSAREARAASLVQGWFNVGKQRAARDRAPRGVRLHYGPALIGANTVPFAVTKAQFLEQPEDFTGGMVFSPPTNIPIVPTYPAPASLAYPMVPGGVVGWRFVSPTVVEISTGAPHFFYVGESVTIAGTNAVSPMYAFPDPQPPPPPPPPPPPMLPPPPPPPPVPTQPAQGTPQEFQGPHTVLSVTSGSTFTFTYTGPFPQPMPWPDPANWRPDNGRVFSGSRFVFVSDPTLPQPSLDMMNGYYPATPGVPTLAEMQLWSVQPAQLGLPGDYIEFFGSGLMSQITSVKHTPGQPMEIEIQPGRTPISMPTSNYRILRAARAVGDESLDLPDGTLIDLQTNAAFGNILPTVPGTVAGTGYVDILFSPSGSVITRGLTAANINLWVRRSDDNPATITDVFKGDPTIISVFVRTGFVGVFPPDRTSPSPYALIR